MNKGLSVLIQAPVYYWSILRSRVNIHCSTVYKCSVDPSLFLCWRPLVIRYMYIYTILPITLLEMTLCKHVYRSTLAIVDYNREIPLHQCLHFCVWQSQPWYWQRSHNTQFWATQSYLPNLENLLSYDAILHMYIKYAIIQYISVPYSKFLSLLHRYETR